MTPELKSACEVVFQEHKTSVEPINWDKSAFRGRISFGLSAMAKETLVNKNIIYSPNPAKKIITSLNPNVASATSVEEAEKLVQNQVPFSIASKSADQPGFINNKVNRSGKYNHVLKVAGKPEMVTVEAKWYLKPLFYYFVWPACAAAAGALIAWLLGLAYMEIFF
ncbi:MAG: hypothetical protein WDN26_20005 [Chitinophagaceae bacterium]